MFQYNKKLLNTAIANAESEPNSVHFKQIYHFAHKLRLMKQLVQSIRNENDWIINK